MRVKSMEAAWNYARQYYRGSAALQDFELLAKYCPDVFAGYMHMREGLFREPRKGALSAKEKELILVGIEVSNRKTTSPPIGHTRRAIESGATVDEVAQVVGLCVMLCGMITYRESGRFVLQAAIDAADEQERQARGVDPA